MTSRRLYNLSIKRLYHTVTLDVGTGDDKYFISMLNAHNQGLKHIRVLDLSIEVDGPDERSALGQSQFMYASELTCSIRLAETDLFK